MIERKKTAKTPREHFMQAAAIAIAEVLDSIGDTCPECPAE